MSEKIKNYLYLAGVFCVQYGAVIQIVKTYSTQSAADLALWYFLLLLIGHLLHFPRSFSSKHGVWKFNCVISTLLIFVILMGVVIYG